MKEYLRGKTGFLIGFLLISLLVAGGLGWATAGALRLEQEQAEQRADARHAARLRLAMWRLDTSVAPTLAREDARPFNHFSPIFAPPLAFNANGDSWAAGEVLQPSPLLGEELPDWMVLHFQTSRDGGWLSPQVPTADLIQHIQKRKFTCSLDNVTDSRSTSLRRLAGEFPTADFLRQARAHAKAATQRETTLLVGLPSQEEASRAPVNDYLSRFNQRARRAKEAQVAPQVYERDAALNVLQQKAGNEIWTHLRTNSEGGRVVVRLSPLVPFWAAGRPVRPEADRPSRQLVLLRLVRIEKEEVVQGILLDDARLRTVLAEEVNEMFPEARLVPVKEPLTKDPVPDRPEQTMTALPYRLDVGDPPAPEEPGWTPLRVGLALAWVAALVALGAVGLGGWSLLDLSDRRIRFVSAVTHELRTPLTTFRLYLDMLAGGLVRDEQQRAEYVHTLNGEAERLHRLVANVLDFSRLENQRPELRRAPVEAAELLAGLASAWEGRCREVGKEIVIENALPEGTSVTTDAEVVRQVLGNLIDNACKYSGTAEDRRLWLRARAEGDGVTFEVEDRGPGVPSRERGSIFRAFRRGRCADRTTGGVGLGLPLAQRWPRLLGGTLTLHNPPCGACFRLHLPGR